MNNREYNYFCTECGSELLSSGKCIKCGAMGPPSPVDTRTEYYGSVGSQAASGSTDGLTITYFVLALLNLLGGVPTVISFGGLWLLFGAFSESDLLYLSLLLACLGYCIASVITLVASIINWTKHGAILKQSFLVGVISFVVLAGIPFLISLVG